MLRRLLPISLLTIPLLLSGCGAKKKHHQFKVALLTSGPVTDGGWNQSAWEGLQKIHTDLGAPVDKQENVKASEIAEAFSDFANRGYSLIIGHGDEYSDAAAKVAAKYPNVDFVTTGGTKSAPNLTPIHFATEEGNYLQGMEAAYLSKTGKGGFIGGEQNPPVQTAAESFQKGALAVNPKFDYKITYINTWNDPSAAKTQTLTLLNSGCDIVSHNCDAAAKGMFDTAGVKANVYTFGVNANENAKAPNVFSSVILDIPKAFTDLAVQAKARSFKGGPISMGMKDGAVTLVVNPKFASVIPAAAEAKIKAAEQEIEAGKIQLWKPAP